MIQSPPRAGGRRPEASTGADVVSVSVSLSRCLALALSRSLSVYLSVCLSLSVNRVEGVECRVWGI